MNTFSRKNLYFLSMIIVFNLVGCTVTSMDRDCNIIPKKCDDSSFGHIPLGEIWHFQINGSWIMALLTAAPGPQPTKSAFFTGELNVLRINKCQIKVDLRNMNLGHQGNQPAKNSSVIVNINEGTIGQICVEKGTTSNEQLIALSSNAVSALLNGGKIDKLFQSGKESLLEEDQFGRCPTEYIIERPSRSSFMIARTRILKKCSKINHPQAMENGQLFWRPESIDELVETAKWECRQYFTDKQLKLVKCVHVIRVPETSDFKSQLNLLFMRSETSKHKFKKGTLINYNPSPLYLNEGKIEQRFLKEKLKVYLGIICRDTKLGLRSDAILAYPEAFSLLNRLSQENIVTLYNEAKSDSFCPNNDYIMPLFSSMLRDTNSPAATSAKCQILREHGQLGTIGLVSSLANTLFPTKGTLAVCSHLIGNEYWMDSVLSISTLAGNFRAHMCQPKNRDYDSCQLGLEFDSIVKTLQLKAQNCVKPEENLQKEAVWAIIGLANLGSVGSDVTKTLTSCIVSPAASNDVIVSSLMALGRKRCSLKTTEWLQSLLFNETEGAEIRIEVTKALHNCNYRAFKELVNLVTRGDVDLRSTQVNSYIRRFSTYVNETNSWFHLSRHFDVDLGGIFGLSNNSVLEGDLIFEDSFIPKSLSFNFASDLLKYFGGSAQLKLRQHNLEDILQPLVGPGGSANSLYDVANEAIQLAVNSLLKPSEDAPGRREKRSVNSDDVKEVLSKFKVKISEGLNGMLTAGFGSKFRYLSTFSLDPFSEDWEAAIQKLISKYEGKLLSVLADYKLKTALSWSLRSVNGVLWTFLGNRLHFNQQEGFIGTFQGSSAISFFSSLKSPFSPSVDVTLTPNIAGYWHSSFSFKSPDERNYATAKVATPISGGFDLSLQFKPKIEENLEVIFDLPSSSFSGYSASISKELITNDDEKVDSTENLVKKVPFMKKYLEKGLWSELLMNFPMKVEMEYTDCHEGLIDDIGLHPCIESVSWKGAKGSLVHSKFNVKKKDSDIENFKLTISSKNPGSNSYFLSGLLGSVGGSSKNEIAVVFGLTVSPHATIKILLQSAKNIASFEATVVNDSNLKRIEARSKYGENEYGLKAEILMVQDGGQVSIKPRLVLSRPSDKEDSLLEGYMAHYSSDKLRSITIDIVTDGSLKKVCDVTLKGTTEYRQRENGEWGISFKNLNLISPGINLGVEATLSVKDHIIESNCQVTLDGEVMVLGASLVSSDVSDSEAKYDTNFHFLQTNRPQWDTKLGIIISVYDGEVQTNVSLRNGNDEDQWQFEALHSTSWMFVYSKHSHLHPDRVYDFWSRFLDPRRTIEIKNKINLSTPNNGWNWMLFHEFQISHYSLENQVKLETGDESYKIMANLYDQSDDQFKYHLEIEVKFPLWKFSYVDTLLQRGEGDIIGQSVTTMPSGRVYTSSMRVKQENSLDYLLFEFSYDTLVREMGESFRVSAKQSLEYTVNQLNFHLSAEAAKPIFGLEITVDGLQMTPVDLFIKAFWVDIAEWEVSSRSTDSQTDVGLTLELIPYDKNLKSKIVVGRRLSGGGALDGEILISSSTEPTVNPVTLALSTSLELEKQGFYVIKNDVSLMGWGWSAELITDLGRQSNDPQKFNFTVLLPDNTSFNGDSVFLFTYEDEEQILIAKSKLKLPSGTFYQFAVDGGSKFPNGSLSTVNLDVLVDTPFTEKMSLETYVRHSLSDKHRNFEFYCDTHSEANYWKTAQTNLTWKTDIDEYKLVFDGRFGNQSIILDSSGSYKFANDTRKVTAATEIKLPSEDTVEQLKVVLDGEVHISSSPPVIKLSQKSYLEKNFVEIFSSDGNLHIKIPEASGKFTLAHSGTKFKHQEYTIEGAFTGRELEISVQGMIDHIPVRITSHYIDGVSLNVFASYGGSSYASIAFVSELEGFALALREEKSAPKLTTNGHIIWRKRQTSFNHVLVISQSHTSSSLRIDSIRGRSVKIHTSRSKLSPDQWRTESIFEWGAIKMAYNDEVRFRTWKDFKVESKFNCPAYKIRDIEFSIDASHISAGDQKVYIKLSKEAKVIHSGRFSIETDSFALEKSWKIFAELSDIVVNQMEYSDLRFKQILTLPESGIELDTSFQRGGTPVAEITLGASEGEREIFFSLCSSDRKCIRLRGAAQSFSKNSLTRNFAVDLKILNSLFWKKSDEDIVQHSFGLTAENNYMDEEEFRLFGKLDRTVCEDISCETSSLVGKHHIHLTIAPRSVDVMYETKNRAMLVKTIYQDDIPIDKLSNENYSFESPDQSKLLQIKFWFDRLRKPDEVILWKTAYVLVNRGSKMEEFIDSIISHPLVDRPLSLTGKLTTDGGNRGLSHEIMVDFDIFYEKETALQLHAKSDVTSGIHYIDIDLKRVKDERNYLTLTIKAVPSPDFGLFDLKIETPVLYEKGDRSVPFNFKAEVDVNRRETLFKYDVSSQSISESWIFGYGEPKEPSCSGMQIYGDVFDRYYRLYGLNCKQWPIIKSGASLTENPSEDLAIRVGLNDAKSFEVNVINVIHGVLILRPPYLLQGSFSEIGRLDNKLYNFKEVVVDQWKYLVLKTKVTMSKAVKDGMTILENLEELRRSSQINELSKIIQSSSNDLIEELQNDELFQDISYGFVASVNVSSLLVNEVVSYVETMTGRNVETLSYYVDLIKESCGNLWQRVVETSRQELHSLVDHCKATQSYVTLWIDEKWAFVLEESVLSEPLKWFQYKTKTIYNFDVWPFMTRNWKVVKIFSEKALTFVYDGFSGSLANRYNAVVPLPVSIYALKDVRKVIWIHPQSLLQTVTLKEKIAQWGNLVLHPDKLLSYIFYPSNAPAVIVRDYLITFDGKVHHLDSSCPHLLFANGPAYESTTIAIATDAQSFDTIGERQYHLFVGNDSVIIHPTQGLVVNDVPVNLPYKKNSISISRDLKQIDVTVEDKENRPYISLLCKISGHSCLLNVNGWLQADTYGLLGTLDYNHYNDYVEPDGMTSLNGEIWEDSWALKANCSSKYEIFKNKMVVSDSHHKSLCSEILLNYHSPVLACHDTVNVIPYYEICLKSLQDVHSPLRNERIHSTMKMMKPNEHENDHHGGLKRSARSVKTMDNYYVEREEDIEIVKSLNQSLLETSIAEKDVLCDVISTYVGVCFLNKIPLRNLAICDHTKTYPDAIKFSQIVLDFLFLIEEASCSRFITKNLISFMPKDMKNLFKTNNFNTKFGVIGYGLPEKNSMTYYSKGSSLLMSLHDVQSLNSSWDVYRGHSARDVALHEGIDTILRFPFREGSIKVVFVASCSNLDITMFDSALPLALRNRHLLLYSLTTEMLVDNPDRPKTTRNTIGIDATNIYHLRRGKVSKSKTWGIIEPTSNIAQLSLQTGGGVFTVTEIEKEKKSASYMSLFRDVFIKDIVSKVKSIHSNSVNDDH